MDAYPKKHEFAQQVLRRTLELLEALHNEIGSIS